MAENFNTGPATFTAEPIPGGCRVTIAGPGYRLAFNQTEAQALEMATVLAAAVGVQLLPYTPAGQQSGRHPRPTPPACNCGALKDPGATGHAPSCPRAGMD